MIPAYESHLGIIEKVIPQIHLDIQNYVKSGKQLTGDMFRRPVKTGTGFSTGDGSPKDTFIDWSRSLEQIYGKSFENCPYFQELVEHLTPFYSVANSSPPRWSTGDDLTHETKLFLNDILAFYSTFNATYSLPAPKQIADMTYNFLVRTEDEYLVEAPLLGIEISEAQQFNCGSLIPIDLEKRIDFMRERSLGLSRYRGNGHSDWTILQAATLLQVTLKWSRSDKAMTMMTPVKLQTLCDNILQLIRIFSYGGTQSCFQAYYLLGIGKRSRGVISPGSDLPHRKSVTLNNPQHLIDFLNKHNSDKRIDDDHELSFIINRMAETWGRSRTDDFQVFDYVAILEALLVPNSEPETAFKVSLYTAHLISTSTEEKNLLFELVRKAYKVRNAIAHCKAEIKEKERLSQDEMKKFGETVHKIIRLAFNDGVEKLRQDAKTLILR